MTDSPDAPNSNNPGSEESLHHFPCEFHLKVIGKNSLDFQATVLSIMRKHIPELSEGAVSLSSSKNAKYLSLTVTFIAESKPQLDTIYIDLSSHDEVIMTL